MKKIQLIFLVMAMTGLNGNVMGQTLDNLFTGVYGEISKGTAANPYKISSPRDLDTLSYFVRNGKGRCTDKYFQMTNNIDMSLTQGVDGMGRPYNRAARAQNFIPIGGRDATETTVNDTLRAFAGNFDGNNFCIDKLRIVGNNVQSGLFNIYDQSTNSQTIKNLGIINSVMTGGKGSGFIIGTIQKFEVQNIGNVTIDHCYVENSTMTVSGGYAGLVVGQDCPIITNSYVKNCSITNTGSTKDDCYVGGFVGDAEGGYVEFCYVQGCTIRSASNAVGGFCGDVDKITTKSCFVTNTEVHCSSSTEYDATITTNKKDGVGGFFGVYYKDSNRNSTVKNCYTTAKVYRDGTLRAGCFGGFCGGTEASGLEVASAFYINTWKGTSNLSTGTNTLGTSKTEADMKNNSNFVNTSLNATSEGTNPWKLDYSGAWGGGANYGFPIFGTEIPFIIDAGETITINAVSDATNCPNRIIIEEGGSLVNNTNTNLSTTNITVKHNLFNERWAAIGSPFQSATYGEYVGNDGGSAWLNIETNQTVSMIDFSYNTNRWENRDGDLRYHVLNLPMERGRGYLAYVFDDRYDRNALTEAAAYANIPNRGEEVVQSHKGVLYNDSQVPSFTLINTGPEQTPASAIDGIWYALSNPYPASLYAKKFYTDNLSQMRDSYLYALNSSGTWDILDGSNSTDKIKIGEGFFVAGQTGLFSPVLQKSQLTPPVAPVGRRDNNRVTVTVSTGQYDVDASLIIDTGANNGLDSRDAYKKFGHNKDLAEPYFEVAGSKIAINSFSSLPYECKMNIRSCKPSSEIKLVFSDVPSSIQMYLIDGERETKIEDGDSYSVIINEGDNEGRFRIKFI
ncbi:MAG: hypothetical protein LBH19_06585 [Dysgonamonadaceae bacterium]|jgi:hypothetical protein|nr:hypothetical protein [Dysgonamonadaceae bacterium]